MILAYTGRSAVVARFLGVEEVPGWPPKTYPRPFSNVAPRRDEFPLTRGEFKSQRQFKLSGRRKSGYGFLFIRAVAQSGSALPWGGRGPGFESRRPDGFGVWVL